MGWRVNRVLMPRSNAFIMAYAVKLFGVLLVAVVTGAAAQTYPAKPVRLIVPSSAGGGIDMLGRLLSEKLAPLGQPFIVDNRAGGGGSIGHDAIAKAPPDGYTLLVTANILTVNQAVIPKLSFNVLRDFTPIVPIASSPMAIGAKLALPPRTLQELITLAKASRLSYRSCGAGSPHHFAAEMIKAGASIDFIHVPYKGCAPLTPDILNGTVDVFVTSLANVHPHMRAGKLKIFSITSAKRSSLAPEIPGLKEVASIKGVDIDGWYALLGPHGMPPAIVTQLNRVVNEAIATPETRALLAARFFQVTGGTSEELAMMMKQDVANFTEVVRTNKITPD